MLLMGPAAEPFSAATVLLLLAALVLDALFGRARGPFERLPHPVRLIGASVSALDHKLNRPHRSAGDKRVRGLFAALFIPGLAFAAGYAITWVARLLPHGWILELFAMVPMLAQRSLYTHVAQVAAALAEGGLPAGRKAVAMIVGRDVQHLDEHGVARAAIESCAESFSDAVVAPAFWYLMLGLPGLFMYKAVNTLDSMIGHRDERYRDFGMASARFDDLLNLVPARLAGLMLAFASSAMPTMNGEAALRVMRRDARLHRSPNAGWPEAAMAGALGLALSGPRSYPGHFADDPWLCREGRAQATILDIGRALMLYLAACILLLMTLAALSLAMLLLS